MTNLQIVNLVGFLAFLITVTYTCLGLPVQIYKNHQSKSISGLSLTAVILLFFTFTSWVAYGWVKPEKDWFVIGSNFPGILCTVVILYQFMLYRKR